MLVCPYCLAPGSSTVSVHETSINVGPLQHFYDETGVYHHHDMSLHTTAYSCSAGHRWQDTVGSNCSCGWSGGQLERLRIE